MAYPFPGPLQRNTRNVTEPLYPEAAKPALMRSITSIASSRSSSGSRNAYNAISLRIVDAGTCSTIHPRS